eukprot:TRINITY_DN5012_c0_g1_i1.p1 TRINITY_DN5012_c0_g1~~TRINITY_DN5012_c0_g1_i1.p1  ORF type:complete len:101 (-),score=13.27 TRINITY_DN5012_c0_g1_i1:129-386(-)
MCIRDSFNSDNNKEEPSLHTIISNRKLKLPGKVKTKEEAVKKVNTKLLFARKERDVSLPEVSRLGSSSPLTKYQFQVCVKYKNMF